MRLWQPHLKLGRHFHSAEIAFNAKAAEMKRAKKQRPLKYPLRAVRGASHWLPKELPGLLVEPLHHGYTDVFVRPESTALQRSSSKEPAYYHQRTAPLCNPPRHSYSHQEKASWHAHKGCHRVAQKRPSPRASHCPGHAIAHALEGAGPHTYQTFHVISMILPYITDGNVDGSHIRVGQSSQRFRQQPRE